MSHLEDQAEWDELLAAIPTDTPTREAASKLADLLGDAVQAQRPWARQRLAEAVHAGLAKTWRSHVQRQRPKLRTKNGDVKTVGGVRRNVSGQATYVQVPLDTMTFEELTGYRAMHVANLTTIAENAKVADRLLALHERCPDAATPGDACELLGIELEAVMAGAA